MRHRALIALVVAASGVGGPAARAAQPWVPVGTVESAIHVGHVTYVGGFFTGFGPPTGPLVLTSASSGTRLPGIATLEGSVGGVAALPGGGVVAGGSFAQPSGTSKQGLVWLDAHGRLSSRFTPVTSEGTYFLHAGFVFANIGDTLFVAGPFGSIGGVTRNGLAAISIRTGAVLAWSPPVSGAIRAMAIAGGHLYLAGDLTYLQSQSPAPPLLALDPATGVVVPGVVPSHDGNTISAMVAVGSTVYFGGIFGHVGGGVHHNIARFSAITGAVDAWAPAFQDVYRIAADTRHVYVVADPLVGPSLTVFPISPTTAAIGHAIPGVSGPTGLALIGSTLYIANGPASFSIATATNSRTGWRPAPGGDVTTITPWHAGILVGGEFDTVRPTARANLAAIDDTTGKLTAWNPKTSYPTDPTYGFGGEVSGLAQAGDTLAVVGTFSRVDGKSRTGLAAFSIRTGKVTSFDAHIEDDGRGLVSSVAILGQTVYVSGSFSRAGGVARSNGFAAFSLARSTLTGWAPSVSGTALMRPAAGNIVLWYTAAPYLRAVDASTGSQVWDASADGGVVDVAAHGSTLYLAGQFTHVGGAARFHVAAVDAATGHVTAFAPAIDAANPAAQYWNPKHLAVAGRSLYLLGRLTSDTPTVIRTGGALNLQTGAISPWSIAITDPGSSLAVTSTGILVFGAHDSHRYPLAAQTTTATLAADVLFAFDSSVVKKAGYAAIKALAPQLTGAKAITCAGHTDNVGTAAYNLALGRARAKAVCAALVPKGFKGTVRIVSKGETEPVAPNDTPENRARNRRVVVTFAGV